MRLNICIIFEGIENILITQFIGDLKLHKTSLDVNCLTTFYIQRL